MSFSYRITTDSTADMSQKFYQENDVKYLGLSYKVEDKEYREGTPESLSNKEFYDKLKAGAFSSTSQINTYDFIDFLEPFLKNGEDVFHVCFSSGLSGTFESCHRGVEELKEKYPERKIYIVDTLGASCGEGLMVHYVVENRKNGMSIEENAKWLEDNKLNFIHLVTIDDLMHLHRGGRVSKTSAVMGTILGIKPIIHMDNNGKLQVIAKVRGREKAMLHLVERMEKVAYENLKDQLVIVGHGDCLEDAEKLASILRERCGIKNVIIGEIGTVIGSHTAGSVVTIFFMGTER